MIKLVNKQSFLLSGLKEEGIIWINNNIKKIIHHFGKRLAMNLFGTPKYGFVFISINQSLKSSSIRKSYPRSSKAGFLLFGLS